SEKRATEEAGRLVKEQARRKADLTREQAIEKALKARKAKGSEKRATEEAGRLVKEQARRKADLTREQAIAEDQEARRLKAKRQPSE
ncbi:MAG: signal recognition particle-docking protein FtsY, partial [Dehalococcoidia bacterium]